MTGIYHQSFLLFIQYYFASTETAFKIVINPAIIPATAHIIPLNIPIDLTVIGDKFNTITKAQVIGAIITIVIIPITKADAYLFFGKKPTILLAPSCLVILPALRSLAVKGNTIKANKNPNIKLVADKSITISVAFIRPFI